MANSWKRGTPAGDDVRPISVGSTAIYSYERPAIEVSQGLSGGAGSWLILTSQQSVSGGDFDIGAVYNRFSDLDVFTVHWDPGTVHPLVLVDDDDGDESEPALSARPGLTGSYHASWVDANTLSDPEVLYGTADFADLETWLLTEEVSAASGALPNVHFELGGAASSAIALAADGLGDIQPVVAWADSRNATVDVYAARRGDAGPTATPFPSPTPSPTPAPVPATTPIGGAILILGLSLVLLRRR